MIRNKKESEKKQEDYFSNLKREGVKSPKNPSGVKKEMISAAFRLVDHENPVLIDVVLCLLDDSFPSLLGEGLTISDGATTSNIACYVGILMRRGNKLDREGRDHWIKPLVELGIIRLVTFRPKTRDFVDGHLRSKSPYSAYCLNSDFVALLKRGKEKDIRSFFASNTTTKRRLLHAKIIKDSKATHGNGPHAELIRLACDHYAPYFLPGYEVLYVDDSDGDRISKQEKKKFDQFGIALTLEDRWPDVLLINPTENSIWFIEAVVSDGEVDGTKMQSFLSYCGRHGKNFGGATTCYHTWMVLASRQTSQENLAVGSHIWVASDPTKHLLIGAGRS